MYTPCVHIYCTSAILTPRTPICASSIFTYDILHSSLHHASAFTNQASPVTRTRLKTGNVQSKASTPRPQGHSPATMHYSTRFKLPVHRVFELTRLDCAADYVLPSATTDFDASYCNPLNSNRNGTISKLSAHASWSLFSVLPFHPFDDVVQPLLAYRRLNIVMGNNSGCAGSIASSVATHTVRHFISARLPVICRLLKTKWCRTRCISPFGINNSHERPTNLVYTLLIHHLPSNDRVQSNAALVISAPCVFCFGT